MLTDYRLKRAEVDETDGFNLRRGDQFLHYELTNAPVQNQDASLKSMIQAIDRAYAVRGERLVKTQIVREKWPIESVTCANFSTNFFSTAKFLGAFEVKEVIDYDWLPAEKV